MKIFNKLFDKKDAKKQLTDDDIKEMHWRAKVLIESVFDMYYANGCQCAYPRFQQMVDIARNSCMCFDTELIINTSQKYFKTKKSELCDENTNEQWVCEKCSSTYEYGWSDFSIYVSRQKLNATKLNVKPIGKPTIKPIPIFLGMRGYSYPSQSEVVSAGYEVFEKYILEQ